MNVTHDPRRHLAVALLGAVLAFGSAACGSSAGPEEGTTLEDLQAERAPAAGGADEEDIAAAPNDDTDRYLPDQASHLGERVTVSGRIVEVLHPQVFVVGKGDLATLVTRRDTGLVLQPGTVAQVTGTVGRFVLVDVEEDLGADLTTADVAEFEQAPFIAADDVNLLDG